MLITNGLSFKVGVTIGFSVLRFGLVRNDRTGFSWFCLLGFTVEVRCSQRKLRQQLG